MEEEGAFLVLQDMEGVREQEQEGGAFPVLQGVMGLRERECQVEWE